jgi:CRP-like cAMP-binding protein
MSTPDSPSLPNSQDPLQALTEQEREELVSLQRLERRKKGEHLFRSGQPLSQYFTVVEGCVRTYHLHDGEEFTLDFYTEGQTVLPAVASKGIVAPSFAVCMEDCLLNVTDEQLEQEVFARLPRLKEICRQQGEQLQLTHQQELALHKSATPEQRYAHLLATRPSLLQRVPQYQIASYLGIKPESLSRLRKRLQAK